MDFRAESLTSCGIYPDQKEMTMKALIASLAAVVLLCLLVLIGKGLANNQTWYCDGPYVLCTASSCISQGGTCPQGGMNAGMPYSFVVTVPEDVWYCVPVGPGCNDSKNLPWCSYLCYQTRGMTGTCLNNLCADSSTMPQCP